MMKSNKKYEERLISHGVRPTAVRVMTLKAMESFDTAFSMKDIEQRLDTVDGSSIFRTIGLFMERHIIHSIDDGSGYIKYSLCDYSKVCSLDHLHVHFTCSSCRKTFCIRQVDVPIARLPAGFVLQDVNYVLKGLCPDCAADNPDAEDLLRTGIVTHHI